MKPWWLLVVSVALLLSGCTSNEGDRPAGEVDDPPPEVLAAFEDPITLSGCQGLEVIMPMPADTVRPYVPADFTVPDNPLVIVGAFICPDGVAARGFVAIQVVPVHDALRSPDAESYFWEPEHYVVNGTGIGGLFATARENLTLADEVTLAGDMTTASFVIEAEGARYSWRGLSMDPVGLAEQAAPNLPPFREYVAADGGYAYLDASFAAGDGAFRFGPGTLTVTGDTVGKAIFGASSERVGGYITELEYRDAKVGFVPKP